MAYKYSELCCGKQKHAIFQQTYIPPFPSLCPEANWQKHCLGNVTGKENAEGQF